MHIWKKKIYFHLIFILSKRIKFFYNSNIFLSYCIFNLYKIFNSFTLLLLLLWTKQILENNYFGKWEKLTWGVTACMHDYFFAVTPNRSGRPPCSRPPAPRWPPPIIPRPRSLSSPSSLCSLPTLLHLLRWFAFN